MGKHEEFATVAAAAAVMIKAKRKSVSTRGVSLFVVCNAAAAEAVIAVVVAAVVVGNVRLLFV